ncbi:hypothetical protein [Pseudarthrobacter sp. YAF2]|uniref:hypothetical protein n=1 Tax=Pseudarthrobacter sp. YAF2 TaxID=3233078 RepID=UPI003F96E870
MNEMLATFPAYTPWIIALATTAWVAKQISDISNAVPKKVGGRSLRRLRTAKDTADLATPGTPEHKLFAERHRREAIRHAAIIQAPPSTMTWVMVSIGVAAGCAQMAASNNGSMLATFVVYNIVSVGPLVALEQEAFGTRRRIRAYCIDNPDGDLGDVLKDIKREASGPLFRWVDLKRGRVRNQLKTPLAARPDTDEETAAAVTR